MKIPTLEIWAANPPQQRRMLSIRLPYVDEGAFEEMAFGAYGGLEIYPPLGQGFGFVTWFCLKGDMYYEAHRSGYLPFKGKARI